MIYILLFILLLLLGFFIFLRSGIQLPKNIDTLISQLQKEPLPILIKGETGTAKNGDVSIFYEAINGIDPSKDTILLICGHTQTLLDWYPHFYQPLIDGGYQVIRFDNRGVGQSDWLKDWGKPNKNKPNKYKLEDMAMDAIAVLDAVGVTKAHLIGMSMGGMIGQRLAISHSDRVLSLTSIMSTGYFDDSKLVNIPPPFMRDIIRVTLRYARTKEQEESKLKTHLTVRRMLQGKGGYAFDDSMVLKKALYEIRERNGYHVKATDQHSYAIKSSGSRYDELGDIKVPTLVIHGTTDPLIDFPHAEKYAPMIPNSEKLFIEGMGHDLPKVHIATMMKAIFNNLAEKV